MLHSTSFWWSIGVLLFFVVVVLLLIGLKIYVKLTTGWCKSNICLKGKTAIVTGANGGIGFETAIDFAKRGARVILACRDQKRADQAREKIISETGNQDVIVEILDCASIQSVRDFARRINESESRLDILVNNAGAGGFSQEYVGPEKLEKGLLVNYYSAFLLTNLLLGLLKRTDHSRVVNVSSIMAKYARVDVNNLNSFRSSIDLYNVTKLCNILFTIELANKLKDTTVTTYSVHPGVVKSEFSFKMPRIFNTIFTSIVRRYSKTVVEGAQTTIYCSVAKGIEQYNGRHFEDCKCVKNYRSVNISQCKPLWDKTAQLVKLDQSEAHNYA